MKTFFKMTLATIVGLLLFSVLGVIISLSFLGAIAASSEKTMPIESNSVFELTLKGVLVERSEENSLASILSSFDDSQVTMGLDDLLLTIDKASKNENIKGLYLNIEDFSAAPASIKEIRQALINFKETGKFITAYADNYTNGTYYLASVADRVAMNPQGILGLTGISMNTVFFKDALDKLGVKMQVFKVGTFKSAVEPYVNTKMSDANRLQMTQLSNSIWSDMLADMSKSRKLDVAVLNRFADEGLFFAESEKAYELGLVDTLIYENLVDSILVAFAGDDYKSVGFKAMKNATTNDKYSSDKVAVVYAIGAIDGGNEEDMKSDKIAETLLELADDDDVKAVVLRVNSPGGSAYGSEQIWHAATLVKAQKPLIVSMGDYAASGGYYISCVADTIVAQPSTITGSIGIFGLLPNFKGLTEKIGLDFDGVKTNNFADFGMVARPVTTAEKVLFQNYVNRGYELFVKRCADGRGMAIDSIKAVAEGRVWTGVDAHKLGLVDVLGGLDTAVELAVQKAGLTNYNLKTYPDKKDFLQELMSDFYTSLETRTLRNQLGENYRYVNYLKTLQAQQGVQAVMPFIIEFE
ncbi:MAG TPA: signal peptide peptidase SppA [Paludibacteraceae bacterium]|nr:signal peptide peptidase SppA [Paludibacteraceae bacterium]HQB69543.1 signal peptide peptidase SppA [Paludibacteraceae bacterium]